MGTTFTGNMTTTPGNGQTGAAPVLDMELHGVRITAEIVSAVDTYWTNHNFLYQPNYPEWLTGPCTLIGYFGGTVALTGYLQLAWIVSTEEIMEKYSRGEL